MIDILLALNEYKNRGYVDLRSYKKVKNSEVMKKKTKREYSMEDRLKDGEDFTMHCARQFNKQNKKK